MRPYLLVAVAMLVFSIPAHAVDGFNLPVPIMPISTHIQHLSAETHAGVILDVRLGLGSKKR